MRAVLYVVVRMNPLFIGFVFLFSVQSVASEMVEIPGGIFLMGAKDYTQGGVGAEDESPEHDVSLTRFWMDQFPVTNSEYEVCVKAGICQPPRNVSTPTRKIYYGNSEFGKYPVVWARWGDARAYCKFVGKDLPTEAQWEKAARGTDARSYPWGEDMDASYANFQRKDVVGDTVEIGHYPKNVSPYGVYDMAGNILQWVRDWYNFDYYRETYQPFPVLNPYNGTPVSENSRVQALRGGSYRFLPNFLRTSARFGLFENVTFPSVGFRCAKE